MICLAALGADLSGYIETSKAADLNIVIDGCPVSCGRKVFERHDIPCKEIVLTQMGLVKGSTPPDAEVVERMTREIKESLTAG